MTDKPHLLWHADAADVCASLPASAEIDLVYLDPPYSVGSIMTMRENKGESRGRKSATGGRDAYRDRGNVDDLIAHLEPRIAAIRACMSEDGAFYLHMDHRAVHDAKILCDRLFGRSCFAGEIIWQPGNGARGARGFSVTHQTILVYGRKDRRVRFSTDHSLLREPYSKTSLKTHFRKTDADGRNFRERVVNGKSYRYYADAGRRIGSVWSDAPAMSANSPLLKEGTGYPTQKPERLLERIIRAGTDEGQTVADLMCGSGTTLVVAAQLGRRFIGGDRSAVAIEITRKRLDDAKVPYRECDPASGEMRVGHVAPT